MPKSSQPPVRTSKKTIIKASFLLVLILGALFLYRFTDLLTVLSPENLEGLIREAGILAPLIFIVIHGLTICLFLPASMMVVASGILFSDFWGFLYAWMGTLAGASGAFYISRTLGREFIEPFFGKRAMKYDSMIRENGFTAVLYMRLLQLPFTPLNFCLGLTGVRFRDYLSGTAIGVLTGLFVFYYLGRTLRGIFVTGNWGELLSLRFLAAFSILLFSLAVPTAIKRYKKRFT